MFLARRSESLKRRKFSRANMMFSPRRRANKSLLGVQVCAPWKDGFFYGGVIEAVKSRPSGEITFTIIFENGYISEVDEEEVVGPGFKNLSSTQLKCGQPVYIWHNGREVEAIVVRNRAEFNEVLVQIPYQQGSVIAVRPDEVSLLKGRKHSDQVDENRDDSQLMCPVPCKVKAHGTSPTPCKGCSRSQENLTRSEEMAALVLTALSISPVFEKGDETAFHFPLTPDSGSELAVNSLFAGSPPSSIDDFKPHSPPSSIDEGIAVDFPKRQTGRRKRKTSTGSSHQVKTLFQCTWPGCGKTLSTVPGIIRHVRTVHLGPKKHDGFSDGEEEFYFNEVDLDLDEWAEMPPTPVTLSLSPTQSHFDMVKSPWSEPSAVSPLGTLNSIENARFNWDLSESSVPYRAKHNPKNSAASRANAQHRKMRGESKKCRKVYGMDNRHMWCTQCRWKKACVRFTEKS